MLYVAPGWSRLCFFFFVGLAVTMFVNCIYLSMRHPFHLLWKWVGGVLTTRTIAWNNRCGIHTYCGFLNVRVGAGCEKGLIAYCVVHPPPQLNGTYTMWVVWLCVGPHAKKNERVTTPTPKRGKSKMNDAL